MSSDLPEYEELAILDFIAIGHIAMGSIAFTLVYYPFVLLGIPSAVMVGWAFFMSLISNRIYLGIETKILDHLNLIIKRDGPGAVIFLTILCLIGSLISLAMNAFWINCLVIAVELIGYYLLFRILKSYQGIPVSRKINVKRLAKQYAKVNA
jgi:hypothetical protein